jgi:hypothetical protein
MISIASSLATDQQKPCMKAFPMMERHEEFDPHMPL